MPDDLYERDILTWSEHQADLLRRVARGELVNGVDWEHVVEEIEDVGLAQLNAVESYLRLVIVHLLKIHGWPDSASVGHWRGEVVSFQRDLVKRFAPSMSRRIDLEDIYAVAREQTEVANYDGRAPLPWPEACPFTLDQLLNERRPVLEAILVAGQPAAL